MAIGILSAGKSVLNTYIANTNTNFVIDTGTSVTVVKNIVITNPTLLPLNVKLVVVTSLDVVQIELLPVKAIAAQDSVTLNLSSFQLTTGDKIIVNADAGLQFYANLMVD